MNNKSADQLRGCTGWSAPLLFATPRRQVFSRRGPLIHLSYKCTTVDFQQCGILIIVDSDAPVQPPFKLRYPKLCPVSSLFHSLFKRPPKALIRLRIWSHISYCWKSHVAAHFMMFSFLTCTCMNLVSFFVCIFRL